MKSLVKFVTTILIILTLMGSTTAAFAQENQPEPNRPGGLRGKVTAIDGPVITIQNREGESQQITTDDKTRIRIGREKGALEDIEIGDPLAAAGIKNDDGSFLARLIIIATPGQIRRHTLRGEVLEVNLNNQTLTVQGQGSQEKTWLVKTIEATRYRVPGVDEAGLDDIEVGNHVLIVGQKDQDSENSGVAWVIAVIPEGGRAGLRLRGQVTAVDESNHSFTLDTRRGEFTVLTDESTLYLTRGDEEVSFDDIDVGSKVLVGGQKVEEQENTVQAKRVGLKLNPEGGNSN